jgi:hypothetical protein
MVKSHRTSSQQVKTLEGLQPASIQVRIEFLATGGRETVHQLWLPGSVRFRRELIRDLLKCALAVRRHSGQYEKWGWQLQNHFVQQAIWGKSRCMLKACSI